MSQAESPRPLGPPGRLTLRFAHPDDERAYWRWLFDRDERGIRAGWMMAVAMLSLMGVVEWLLFPAEWPSLWPLRYGVVVPACLAGLATLFVPRLREKVARPHLQELILAVSTVGFGAIGAMGVLLIAHGDVARELFLGLGYMLSVTFIYLGLRLRFVYATLLGVGTYVASVGVLLWADAPVFAIVSMGGAGASANAFGMFGSYTMERAERRRYAAERAVTEAQARVEGLLRMVLPPTIATRLKAEPTTIAERHDAVTVLFADVVGFTPLSASLPPDALVALLDRLFSAFDRAAARHGVEKIKTIGDAYMAAAGAPSEHPEDAAAVARLALDLRDAVRRVAEEAAVDLDLRIGLHRGPVVGGVIGRSKLLYDLWGDTVNVASRMESHGAPGRIQVSAAVQAQLGEGWQLTPRGAIAVKGRGEMETWWLEGAP